MKFMIHTRCTLTTLALIAAMTVPAEAQTALLRGTVVDADGAPVQGVKVIVTSEELGSYRKTLTTDKDGEFSLRFQPNQAQYLFELLFEKPGYQSFVQQFSPSLTQRMAEEYVIERAQSEVVETRGDLGSVVTGSTNEAVEAFNAGVTAQRQGDLDAALGHFQEAVATDPTLVPARLALSQLHLDQGDYEAALTLSQQALELAAGNVDALRLKHQSLLALGQRDEAEVVAIELERAEGAVASALRLYNEGGAAFQAGDKVSALVKFQQAATLDPSLTDAHHAVATLQFANGDYEASAAAAELALEQGSDDVRTLRVLYDAYQELGRSEQLAEIAPRLAAIDPDFGGSKLVEQAAGLWNSGEAEQATSLAKLALSIDDSLGKAWYFVGLDHLAKGENAEARAALTRFLELSPEDSEAEAARGMLEYIQ